MNRRRWIAFVLAGVVVFAIAYRLPHIGRLSLWMDEGFYHLAAQEILDHGYPLYPSGHVLYKGILYSYILAFFGLIFGMSAVTLRVVSLVAAAAVLPFFYLLARKIAGRTLALVGVGMLLFSVWETEYARTVLYFAPMQLVYILGLWLFYKAYFEDDRRYVLWTFVVFALAPHFHQLAMALGFAFPALLLARGAKRFFRKDVLWPFGVVVLAYAMIQVHEMFFWKVGFVYEKAASSFGDVIRYFFASFSPGYFTEILKSFPGLGLLAFFGVFLFLGEYLRRRDDDAAGGAFLRSWMFINFCLVFPLLFIGFFRTHVSPRYVFQIHPILILAFLIALQRTSAAVARIAISPFVAAEKGRKPVLVLSWTLFAAGVVVLADQTGWGATRAVVERRYKDPISTDLITRSGRFEHFDHRGPGEYVRQFLKPGDRVIAMQMVFQYIYAGRVDYWLWSGGPGTWDAWEKTADGWKDVYVGSRWINNLADLKTVTESDPNRRIWLIASPSIEQRAHINKEIAAYIKSNDDKLVFRGKDGTSSVYVWNDRDGLLEGAKSGVEAEWLPLSFGRVEYVAEASRRSVLRFDRRDIDEDETVILPGEGYEPGRYRFVFRAKRGPSADATGRLGLILVSENEKREIRRISLSSGDFAESGIFREFSCPVVLLAAGRIRLRVVVRGGTDLSLDYLAFERTPNGD